MKKTTLLYTFMIILIELACINSYGSFNKRIDENSGRISESSKTTLMIKSPARIYTNRVPLKVYEKALKVNLFGDSTSTGFTLNTFMNSFLQVIDPPNNSNIFRSNRSDSKTILHQLNDYFPLVIGRNYSVPGSVIESKNLIKNAVGKITNTNLDLDDMMVESQTSGSIADINIFWMGHNNVDWPFYLPKKVVEKKIYLNTSNPFNSVEIDIETLEDADPYEYLYQNQYGTYSPTFELKSIINSYLQKSIDLYIKKLREFIRSTFRKKNKTAVVVFGLMNTNSFIKHRKSLHRKALNGEIPFYFEAVKKFKALNIDFLEGLRYSANKFNEMLEKRVKDLSFEYKSKKLLIYYSDSISQAELTTVSHLSSVDGWHYSETGHEFVGDAAFSGLLDAISFMDKP